jgi:hypothetical protein
MGIRGDGVLVDIKLVAEYNLYFFQYHPESSSLISCQFTVL